MVVFPLVAWGLLAFAMMALSARWLGATRRGIDRVCATIVLTPLALAGMVRLLGVAHLIAPWPLRIGTIALAVSAWFAAGQAGRALALRDAVRARRALLDAITDAPVLAMLVGLTAFAAAGWAAWLLEPWSWDGLGYHLPVVYDALQEHRLREIPSSVVFVNVYPHAADWLFIVWRGWFANDVWIDFGQAPFAVMCVAAIAATGIRAGGSAGRSIAFAMLFVALPAAALELASNYVDLLYAALVVVAAYFATSEGEAVDVVLACATIALLLAVKPSAPPAAVVLLLALIVGVRAKRPSWRVIAVGLALLAIGSETYVVNLWRHHNPIWPVEMHLGPITLPGRAAARDYIEAGLPAPYVPRRWPMRVIASWFEFGGRYVYDMRVGGLAPLFPLALLPLALVGLARRRTRAGWAPLLIASLAALATPAAFWTRYTLALPAAALAFVVASTEAWPPIAKRVLAIVLAVLGAIGLKLAIPGFTDGGPSLMAVQRMSDTDRASVASIDLGARNWQRALGTLRSGESVGYDGGFELSGLLWRGDGRTRVVYLGERPASSAAFDRWLDGEHVRVAVLDDEGGGVLARRDPARFEPLFRCRWEPCTVFAVRPRARGPRRIVVLAPHPDDEVLTSAGVIADAVQAGDAVDVVIVTNGDYTCERNGYLRENESVAALARLGLAEEHVHFLGYPDGYLTQLAATPLAPIERRDSQGNCEHGNTTYAARGAGAHDEHSVRAGAAATYTADALRGDIEALLTRLEPTDIYVTHSVDEHPDHARTYTYLRRALDRVVPADGITVHRAIVHAGPCWPNGSTRREPCPAVALQPRELLPPLPAPLTGYTPRERRALSAAMRDGNMKFEAIARYLSQTGPDPAHDWLASFARSEEWFFPERIVRDRRDRAHASRADAFVRDGMVGAIAIPPGQFVEADGWWRAPGAESRTAMVSSRHGGAFRCSVEIRDALPESEWSLRMLGGEVIALQGGAQLVVSHEDAAGERARWIRETLPDDGTRAASHHFEVRVDPRPDDGDVVEITIRRDGEFLATAVVTAAASTGNDLRITTRGMLAFRGFTCAAEP